MSARKASKNMVTEKDFESPPKKKARAAAKKAKTNTSPPSRPVQSSPVIQITEQVLTHHLLPFLHITDLCRLTSTCTEFNKLCSDEQVYKKLVLNRKNCEERAPSNRGQLNTWKKVFVQLHRFTCVECAKKTTCVHPVLKVRLCRKCEKVNRQYWVISRSRAKLLPYKLKDSHLDKEDIEDDDEEKQKKRYASGLVICRKGERKYSFGKSVTGTVYLKRDVMELAQKVHGEETFKEMVRTYCSKNPYQRDFDVDGVMMTTGVYVPPVVPIVPEHDVVEDDAEGLDDEEEEDDESEEEDD